MDTATTAALILPDDSSSTLAVAGRVANAHAARGLFADYRSRRAANTLRRQDNALALFARYLGAAYAAARGANTARGADAACGADTARGADAACGAIPEPPTAPALAAAPAAWRGVTWGLVAGFARWLLGRGYAIGSVNGALSTVKTYARLAMQAGTLDRGEYVAIRAVQGYSRTEGKRVDEARPAARVGAKKAEPVPLSWEQMHRLKTQPNTPQGRRDALLLCLLLDHGLRVGEVSRLQVGDLDLALGELRFYRPKVDRTQLHRLTADTRRAAKACAAAGDMPAEGSLLRGSRRGGRLTGAGMSERAITARVRELGAAVGAAGLSAHDLRHAWATRAARNGTPLDRLQDAGGWSSPAMPLRYVEAARVANEGVRV